MDFDTKCVHGKCSLNACNADRPPLFMNNVYTLGTENFYVRHGNINQDKLSNHIISLYGGKTEHCHILPSGMAAVYVMLDSIPAKSHIIVDTYIYSETRELLKSYAGKLLVSYVDLCDLEALKNNLRNTTSLILVESATNPFYKTHDINAICKIVHEYPYSNIKVCVDNTIYTSYYYNPFIDGADYVIESLGKYTGGHGDVLAGALLGLDCSSQLALKGISVSPFNCWLLQRDIPTLKLRLDRITETAHKVFNFLKTKTKYVLYLGVGGLITFSLGDKRLHEYLLKNLTLIMNGYNFGCEETLALINYEGYYEPNPPGFDSYIRISIGLESSNDIIEDLRNAFEMLNYH